MNQEDIDKNQSEKNTIKIPIPAVNEYPLKDVKHWAKKAYAHARRQVHWRKAKKIKETMPIETAAYAEDKVFGNWRLVAPDGPGKISPLQQVITLIRDEIVPTRWGEFRRKFIREMKICFNAICDADYDPKMVDEVNQRLNQLLSGYTRGGTTPSIPLNKGGISGTTPSIPLNKGGISGTTPSIPLNKGGIKGGCVSVRYILKPETAEDYSSIKNLTIRSRIWERFTGKPLDFAQFVKPEGAQPLSRRMEMFLEACLPQARYRKV